MRVAFYQQDNQGVEIDGSRVEGEQMKVDDDGFVIIAIQLDDGRIKGFKVKPGGPPYPEGVLERV